MALLSRAELKALMDVNQGPCVSIYMPAVQAGPETRQNHIRFKNMMREAEAKLTEGGMRDTNALELLRPAQELDRLNFWRHQNEGLALFVASDFLRYYRLPLHFEEMVAVDDRFHLKPLMPLLTGDGRFYLLAFSQNMVRLFIGSRYSISQVELDDMPTSLKDALRYEDPEEQLRFHSTSSGDVNAGSPMYHGQGVGTTDNKDALSRYCHQLDAGLRELLPEERSPLVLAGVEYLTTIYRNASSYPNLMEKGITGNPDVMRPDELHEQAWKIVEPHFQQGQQAAAEQYRELANTQQAYNTVQDVVPAAYYHQVDTLFVDWEAQRWGTFDPNVGKVEVHEDAQPQDEDLLDFAATQTILNGGTVYAIESDQMPDEGELAAVLRYPATAARGEYQTTT